MTETDRTNRTNRDESTTVLLQQIEELRGAFAHAERLRRPPCT